MAEKEKFFNREISWIEFNARVLAEAMDPSNPLLERLKFIGIVSSNFDEFFMVRIAGLEDADESSKLIREKALQLIARQDDYFLKVIVPELEAAGIVRIAPQALSDKQMDFVKNLFYRELLPVLTPIAITENNPAPVLVNQSLYMVASLADPGKQHNRRYAVIEIPKNLPRIISFPGEKKYSFMLLEDIVAVFSKELFIGYEILNQGLMRLTRAGELTFDEESDEDFALIMAQALRSRRQNEIIRLEISASKEMTEFLTKKLEVPAHAIYEVQGWFDLKSISQLAFHPGFEELKRPAWSPRPIPDFEKEESIWEVLKKKDVIVQHPYESFEVVNRFVSEAAKDPDVLAIKQTFYRAGHDSSIIAALETAAEKGKRVTALVELKARFDEEKNIQWARRLEVAGATVIYGLTGLKTHAKACLVVRREPDGIKRYMHLSTGNYNEKTAQIYSDIGFFTSNEDFANDMTGFFNMITGYSQPGAWSKIVVAPYGLRKRLKQLIAREAMRSSASKPGLILAKMNSLIDPEIIEELYRASKAGVQIKLNVRGICCLRPGVKDMSENIEVTSIVDMFLEHSRMIYFANGGDDELYLSSADWMPRNLDRRVEIMFPVENKESKKEMIDALKLYFKDNQKSWRLTSQGEYQKIETTEKKFRVQEYLCKKIAEQSPTEKASSKELKPQKPRHSQV